MAQSFRKIVRIGGIAAPIVLAVLIISFKSYFSWLDEGILYEAAGSLLVMGTIHLVFAILAAVLHLDILLAVVRYVYVAFFVYLIYITGNINSSFIFTLLLPVITPAVQLDRKGTRNTAIIATLAFGSLIFFLPMFPPVELIVKHIIQTVLLGAISYLVYAAMSETIRHATEKDEADRRITEMVQVERLKSDFLSIAQHQLRTPLSGVKWALEMLKTDNAIPLESQSLIDQSLNRINDSLSIINQMLKTIEDEDTPGLQIEGVDLVGMVRGIIAELNFIVVKKQVKLSFIAPESLLIPADRAKIKAALTNVIDNAIKYSPNGKVDITITDSEKNATMVVKDSGIGIPEDDLPYLFERLHRGKNAVMLEPDESGVGLSISRKIISFHGGTLNINSEVGKGTTATVVLPKEQVK